MRTVSATLLGIFLVVAGCATPGYHAVEGWPDWKCAEAPGDPGQSLWYEAAVGQKGTVLYEGTCASWAQKQGAPGGPDAGLGAAAGPGGPKSAADPLPDDLPPVVGSGSGAAISEETGAFREIEGWPSWLCADYKDGRPNSLWYMEAEGPTAATTFDGRCDSWKQ